MSKRPVPVLPIIILLMAIAVLLVANGQNTASGTPATQLSGTGAPSLPCSGSPAILYDQTDATNGHFWLCDQETGSWAWNHQVVNGTQAYNWVLSPGLFSTATAVGPVYYFATPVTMKAITARVSGSIICVTAPTVSILDLGTSQSTAYGGATSLGTLATSTANGAFTNTSFSAAIAGGHYVGFGLSAGSCVTPPQLDVTITVQ